jgi:hypothetical protein
MRISTGEPGDRDLRAVGGTRAEPSRPAGAARGDNRDRIDADPAVSRSIVRSQAVVAGLRQMRDSLERGETPDVGALVRTVRFEGEEVLAAHDKELIAIAGSRDGARLQRLLENTESNVLALLAQTGVRRPDALLSSAADLPSIQAVFGKTIAAMDTQAGDVTRLRPERVAELLR